ncbi:hypothetical protein HDV00_011731 [Rhizophlyctis rosea]|nr:hypothetical protein HDV00_011731 [Rhizophlyctis rosea]
MSAAQTQSSNLTERARNVPDKVKGAAEKVSAEMRATAAEVPEMAGKAVHKAQNVLTPVYQYVSKSTGYCWGVVNQLMERYPPVKAFVYSFMATAAIPTTVFTGYSLTTGTIVGGIAGTIATVVQGCIMAFGAFFYFWWLVGAFIVASITGVCASGMWIAYSGYKMIGDSVARNAK